MTFVEYRLHKILRRASDGFLTCLLLAGITTTAYAAGIMAERSNHRIFVDGTEVQMEAYTIGGNN